MTEHHIRVHRTARYHMLGDPATARELWIVVHGYGQLARFFLNHFSGLEAGRCIVAPEGLGRFYLDAEHSRVGATWMTREDRLNEIADHVAYLDALVDRLQGQAPSPLPLHVLGFSQGVATVSRWSLKELTHIQRMVLWAGTLPPELDRHTLQAWRGIPVDLVLGDKDHYADAAALEQQAQRLLAAGVSCRTHRFAGGHALEPVLLGRLINGG